MARPTLTQPLVFEPLFMERVWGGRTLQTEFGKKLPPAARIGESWEIVDRSEAQSVVSSGALRGRTLHELWTKHRREIFGDVTESERFPLFIKLLDAQEKLSVQVHPPEGVAAELGGEAKTEFWYVAAAKADAELFAGFTQPTDRAAFEDAVRSGTVAEHLHRIPVKSGDAMFMPSGRVHAIGAGNVMIEIQQNSDTTYRVFDWNRAAAEGGKRKLHIAESLRCIDFADVRPELTHTAGELLVRHELFQVEKWHLQSARDAADGDEFAIVCCLTGLVTAAGVILRPGELFLVPASLPDKAVRPSAPDTSLLRITVGAT